MYPRNKIDQHFRYFFTKHVTFVYIFKYETGLKNKKFNY